MPKSKPLIHSTPVEGAAKRSSGRKRPPLDTPPLDQAAYERLQASLPPEDRIPW